MTGHVCEPRNYRENPPVCYQCGERILPPVLPGQTTIEDHLTEGNAS